MNRNGKIEEMLKQNGVVVYKTAGVSMRPLFKQNRDLVTVRPVTRELKKYDVPLYRRNNGSGYMLHRIIGFGDGCYIIRGDNTFVKEYITPDRIVGVLTEFKRKGKNVSVESKGYKLYSRVWNFLYPLRLLWHNAVLLGVKIKKAIKGNKKA